LHDLGSAVALVTVLFVSMVQQRLDISYGFALSYLEYVVKVVETVRGELVS
jgi:hypothetical protein